MARLQPDGPGESIWPTGRVCSSGGIGKVLPLHGSLDGDSGTAPASVGKNGCGEGCLKHAASFGITLISLLTPWVVFSRLVVVRRYLSQSTTPVPSSSGRP